MTCTRLNGLIAQMRRMTAVSSGATMTDRQVLDAFQTRRDEAAFEVLVRRHGPMVLGVCRRMLPSVHDAEDAFQATFLVLVRKANGIARPGLLPRKRGPALAAHENRRDAPREYHPLERAPAAFRPQILATNCRRPAQV
jgi:Sigma-70 region 2